MKQRKQFIDEYMTDEHSIAELCRRFGVSRKTGYKWIKRYLEGCELDDRSRRPHTSPSAVSTFVEDAIVQARKQRPRWGPRKLRAALLRANPDLELPSSSTFALIFKRNGLIVPRRRRRRTPPSSAPLAHATATTYPPTSTSGRAVHCPSPTGAVTSSTPRTTSSYVSPRRALYAGTGKPSPSLRYYATRCSDSIGATDTGMSSSAPYTSASSSEPREGSSDSKDSKTVTHLPDQLSPISLEQIVTHVLARSKIGPDRYGPGRSSEGRGLHHRRAANVRAQ